ncbi:bifunctional protein-disulfide isomerase/oxidoreductase DsbC [Pseudoalteromonas sp. MMG010]|uniref:bifunctional protein-disulfide isomerase/oxidoreductase DsbC n=1 Tax=Pseudoalteromonas sp. MMG010 TaxID=2822685 RepID=UPI001B3A204B|nr:bifunctional protein-disulfide isomerase/oxidoreductase DsbC [Pseudoalteromonas sp. MMG010]MBQ4832800.1 bifunctional protein-disulfide isomerase/oxidoreductase DsbC [Pseudoalteromonas sp. MMG010]
MKKLLLTCLLICTSFSLLAEDAQQTDTQSTLVQQNDETIIKALALGGIKVTSLHASPINGLKIALTNYGIIYTSNDGQYIIFQNRLIDLQSRETISETILTEARKAKMLEFEDSMLVYKAPEEKYRITVFTDISCGYCRKLHSEIDELLELGITVRYLGFPRAGINSQAYTDLMNVWCADDQQTAMTNAKSGSGTSKNSGCYAPIAEHYEFGKSVGVAGTPAIMLDDGSLISGYMPAKKLAAALEENKASN